MSKFKENKQLFLSFLKVGFFMFGGGYAMLPLLERELIDNKKWITKEELLEIVSVSQMTPGTISINIATYIGSRLSGIWGGIIASIGIIIPSLVTVTAVYIFMGHEITNEYVQKAFLGIRACIVGMIIKTVYKLFKTGISNHITFFIFLLILVGLFLGLSPILAILLGFVAGVCIYWLTPFLDNKGGVEK